MSEYLTHASQAHYVNKQAHDRLHGPRQIVYTSPVALSTTAGTKLRMPRGGQITNIMATVTGAPTSTLQIDLLMDGVSVFDDGYLQILSGETESEPFRIVSRPYFNEDTILKVKLNAVAAATGPLVVVIEYVTDY